MDNPGTASSPQPKKWPGWLVLFLRWLLGGIAGYLISYYLFIISASGPLPVIGFLFLGQVELFNSLLFKALYDNFILFSPTSIYGTSIFLYSMLWGLIGALLASRRRKQIIAGVIFLVLYIIAGGVYFVILAFRMIAT